MIRLAAFPKCYMDELCVTHTLSLFDWIAMASTLGVEGLEMYPGFFTSLDRAYLQDVRVEQEPHGCSPRKTAATSAGSSSKSSAIRTCPSHPPGTLRVSFSR